MKERAEKDARQALDRARNDSELLQRQSEQKLDAFDQEQHRNETRTDKNRTRKRRLGFTGHILQAFVKRLELGANQILTQVAFKGSKNLPSSYSGADFLVAS
jgi:hypothetical protein